MASVKKAAKGKASKKSNQSAKWMFWIIGVFSVCVLGLIFIANIPKKEVAIDYTNQPYLGEEAAPVEIIEFGDYKCPACKNFNDSFVPLIEKELVETGKAKFYFMNYSFINVDSTRSAQFAETVYQELGSETFWKFHDLLFSKQPEDTKYEAVDVYTESYLTDLLKEVANAEDTEKVVQAFGQNKGEAALDTDMSYAKKLGVTGTPTLFVNGKLFEGSSWNDFKQMVEEAAKEK